MLPVPTAVPAKGAAKPDGQVDKAFGAQYPPARVVTSPVTRLSWRTGAYCGLPNPALLVFPAQESEKYDVSVKNSV